MVELTRIAVLSHVLVDDIHLPDGRDILGQLGGAGTYAAIGAALATRPGDLVGIVCGIGADFGDHNLRRLAGYGIDLSAMTVRGPRTPRSRIEYRHESDRSESPPLGAAHLHAMRPDPADIPATWRQLRGIYLFQDDDHCVFDRLTKVTGPDTTVLWEIDVACCRPSRWDSVAQLLPRADWLSINLAEAQALCGRDDPLDCARALRDSGAARVALRMGARGALILDGDAVIRSGTARGAVVDTTGAGNAYGGALLAAWLHSRDPVHASTLAAAASSYVIEQFGPPSRPPAPAAVTARASTVATSTEGAP
jgi:sugar/nucleoside kinase (ribokinase family)